jgi:hypothetical protein
MAERWSTLLSCWRPNDSLEVKREEKSGRGILTRAPLFYLCAILFLLSGDPLRLCVLVDAHALFCNQNSAVFFMICCFFFEEGGVGGGGGGGGGA